MSSDCDTLAETAERANALSEPPSLAWIAPTNEGTNRIASSLVALAGTPLASRFCSWRGVSGRRYVFSVYPASECPAFRNAVLLAALSDEAGRRRMVFVCGTGAFPEPIIARTERELSVFGGSLEFHLHLLASSPAERDAMLADFAIEPT